MISSSSGPAGNEYGFVSLMDELISVQTRWSIRDFPLRLLGVFTELLQAVVLSVPSRPDFRGASLQSQFRVDDRECRSDRASRFSGLILASRVPGRHRRSLIFFCRRVHRL